MEALCRAYEALGFAEATGHDEVFPDLVLARIIERTSKQDCLRVLVEAGVEAPAYWTVTRRLPWYAKDAWRDRLVKVCAQRAAWGPACLVVYDVSTLHFGIDAGDGFSRTWVLQATPVGTVKLCLPG